MNLNSISVLRREINYVRYINQLENYRSSAYGNSWKKHHEYHRRCQESFVGSPRSNELRPYIDSYLKNGFFTYFDSETEQLSQQVYNKLEVEGFVDAKIKDEQCQYKSGMSHHMLDYPKESYTAFPELEKIFRGKTGDIIRGIFGCNFKINFGRIHKSENAISDYPDGSQLWHSDGGPSTCMILFFHFSPVNENYGGTEILPWDISKQIYKASYREVYEHQRSHTYKDRKEARYAKSTILKKYVELECLNDVVQLCHDKPGLIGAMHNNNFHKGGFTKPGFKRLIFMAHVYPTHTETPYNVYKEIGTPKSEPFNSTFE